MNSERRHLKILVQSICFLWMLSIISCGWNVGMKLCEKPRCGIRSMMDFATNELDPRQCTRDLWKKKCHVHLFRIPSSELGKKFQTLNLASTSNFCVWPEHSFPSSLTRYINFKFLYRISRCEKYRFFISAEYRKKNQQKLLNMRNQCKPRNQESIRRNRWFSFVYK